MNDRTTTPFISEETRVKLPLRLVAWGVAIVAAGAIAWGLTTRTVQDQGRRIDNLETDSRSTREVLIRIDERTAEIKRRLDSAR